MGLTEREWSDVLAVLPENPETADGWELSLVRRTVERILTERLAQAWDECAMSAYITDQFGHEEVRHAPNPYRSHADSGRSAGALSGEQGSVRVVGRGEGSGAQKGDEVTEDERADLLASFRNGVGRKPSEGNPR